jgi:hypothetical protein
MHAVLLLLLLLLHVDECYVMLCYVMQRSLREEMRPWISLISHFWPISALKQHLLLPYKEAEAGGMWWNSQTFIILMILQKYWQNPANTRCDNVSAFLPSACQRSWCRRPWNYYFPIHPPPPPPLFVDLFF